jgi:hypothetical protein
MSGLSSMSPANAMLSLERFFVSFYYDGLLLFFLKFVPAYSLMYVLEKAKIEARQQAEAHL